MGCVDEWDLPRDLTVDEADAINDAISSWESADPYDDAAARRLDDQVAEILAGRSS
jgi:hypothetical protein